jgi:hypothetical protein
MSTGIHRAVELVVGVALVGYCAYSLRAGRIMGKFRSYERSERPWSFWSGIIITLGIGLAFLFGVVSWRK